MMTLTSSQVCTDNVRMTAHKVRIALRNFPAMIKNFKVTGTYDDVATWSSDISGTGDIITTDA